MRPLNGRPTIVPTIRDLILPEILLSLPPGDNLKGTVDENTVSNTFSSTLAFLFGLAPAVTPYPSSAVLFGLLEFFGTCLNHSIALRDYRIYRLNLRIRLSRRGSYQCSGGGCRFIAVGVSEDLMFLMLKLFGIRGPRLILNGIRFDS